MVTTWLPSIGGETEMDLRTTAVVAVTSMLASCASLAEAAQTPQPTGPATQGPRSLKTALEDPFRRFSSGCPIGQLPRSSAWWRRLGNQGAAEPVSHIDPTVEMELGAAQLNAPVTDAFDQNVPRLFGRVYSANSLPSGPGSGDESYLSLDFRDQGLVLAPGFSRLQAYTTCTSLLVGAARGRAELTVPVATLKATMDADVTNETRSSLRIANGRLNNPLWEMWTATDLENPNAGLGQFYAGLVLWHWHRDRQIADHTKAAPGAFLLRNFRGVIVYRQLTRTGESSLSGSASARLAVPLAAFSTDWSGTVASTRSVEVDDVRIFLTEDATPYFEPMPSLERIMQVVSASTRATISYPDASGLTVIGGGRANVDVDISAMPAGMCQATAWTVQDTGDGGRPSSSLQINAARLIGEGIARTCRFRMSYLSAADNNGEVTLTPQLVSAAAIGGTHRLQLPLGQMRFEASAGPTLHPDGPATLDPSTQTNRESLAAAIKIKFQVRNAAGYTPERIDVSGLRLSCPGSGDAPHIIAVPFDHDLTVRTNGSGVLTLTGNASTEATPAAGATIFSCQLTGRIVFRDANNRMLLERQAPSVSVNFRLPASEAP